MNEGGRKNRKKEESKERILDAARKLFGSKGFHATTTAELQAESQVSIAQIYRTFSSKDEIVVTITERRMSAMAQEMHAITDAAKHGDIPMFDALKAMVMSLLNDSEVGLVFEILAESCRNPSVAERVASMATFYRNELRALAEFAKPDSSEIELEAYLNVILACLTGLYYRPVISTGKAETSHNVACLLMRALGLPDQALI